MIAEQELRRLQSVVRDKNEKKLIGRAKKFHELTRDEQHLFDNEDHAGERDDAAAANHHPLQRLCMQDKRDKVEINSLSAEKLLEASLESLEVLGRQQLTANGAVSGSSSSGRDVRSPSAIRTMSMGQSPSAEYLAGSLWLGRNLVMHSEELYESIARMRLKYLKDVTSASKDTDTTRALHRLTLLAGCCMTETLTLTTDAVQKSRSILQVISRSLCVYLSN